jgi:hypothetical protein
LRKSRVTGYEKGSSFPWFSSLLIVLPVKHPCLKTHHPVN